MPASRWPLWLIAAVALAALATSLALILRPALPLTLLLGGLAAASALIAGAAIVALVLPHRRAEVLPFAAAAARSEPEVPAAILRELESLRAMQSELVAAKQEAEAATMAKGEFLATMSHEMRTPLNGIIPLLEILRDTRLEPDQREYLNTAYQSARHLLRIIDDILDYSKIEAGKLELETTGLNLREVTDSVVRLMEKNAEGKGVRLSATIDPGVRLAVRGDPVRLRQVLANLVSNGIKFTDKGSVTIQVSRRGDTRTHTELLFVVRVTGTGIDPVVAEKLFRPFSQADASTTRNYGGTGLGLVICKRIVDLMGGKIGLKSELGKGSIFWFSVPMLKAIGDMSATRRSLDGARALIVSSDQRQVQRLATYLQNWGLALISTNTTADALSKLKSSATLGENWAFDVCVVDFSSMRNTAPALVRNVVREPVLERLKLVFLTGEDSLPPDIQVAGRTELIDKGFAEGELQAVFNRVLEIDQPGEQRVSLIEQAQQMAADSAPGKPAVQVAGPLGGHVLLVEDNPVNRQVAQKLLGLIGLSHDHAENGKLALEMAGQKAYDAVLMDCQMPVM
ncbi:MAG: response regulator, partial [Xanthomonadales bacterium]|nr:response regulator [Xanthomonadales bacterium]